jgi:hypothetical protein
MTDKGKATAAKKAREGRSPAFPVIDLKKALERAEQFRLAEGKHSVPSASAKKAWNLGDDTVAGRRTIAALGYYGLFEYEGAGDNRKVRLSDNALKILLDKQPESPERDVLIKKVALVPAIHRELWVKWGPELPSDASFETFLVRDRGFSTGGAHDFMPVYKSTLTYAKLGQSDRMLDVSDEGQEVANMDNYQQNQTSTVMRPVPRPGMLQEVFNLDEGPVILSFPPNLSNASYQDLEDHLGIFLRKAKRRAQQAEDARRDSEGPEE